MEDNHQIPILISKQNHFDVISVYMRCCPLVILRLAARYVIPGTLRSDNGDVHENHAEK